MGIFERLRVRQLLWQLKRKPLRKQVVFGWLDQEPDRTAHANTVLDEEAGFTSVGFYQLVPLKQDTPEPVYYPVVFQVPAKGSRDSLLLNLAKEPEAIFPDYPMQERDGNCLVSFTNDVLRAHQMYPIPLRERKLTGLSIVDIMDAVLKSRYSADVIQLGEEV